LKLFRCLLVVGCAFRNMALGKWIIHDFSPQQPFYRLLPR
jgi:hypothetical protein